ncbi:MAG: flavin reductase family protein [Angustibacter sp.]
MADLAGARLTSAEPDAVDVAEFRRALGRFATGITVVATRVGGVDHAMTANAFTSVSLEPRLVLVCVERDARFHDAIIEAGEWTVSVLDHAHRAVAEWLATRGRPLHGQLDRVPHHRGGLTGAALIDGALAGLECRTTDVHPAGDHGIVVGEVLSVDLPDASGAALLYHRGGYSRLT